MKETKKMKKTKKILLVLAALLVLASPKLLDVAHYAVNARSLPWPSDTDLTQSSWTDAFQKLNNKLSHEYPFTDWKHIDWQARYQQFAPRIAAAEQAKDKKQYYLALREYAYAMHDGHVELIGDDMGYQTKSVGGKLPLDLTGLDDGHTLVTHVEGESQRAGIHNGATVLTWNGQPIADALKQASLLPYDHPITTNEHRTIIQHETLVHPPVGTKVEIQYKNPGDNETRTALLEAVQPVSPAPDKWQAFTTRAVESRMLPDNIGYLKFNLETPTLRDTDPAAKVRETVRDFQKKGVQHIVLDLRHNNGGSDHIALEMAAPFIPATRAVSQLADYRNGRFEVVDTLRVEPQAPHFTGRLSVLIDHTTVSSGEGVALYLKGLPNVTVYGLENTRGMFGTCTKSVDLPEGYTLIFPQGQELDENGIIQLEVNDRGEGGVAPDVRLPKDESTVKAMYEEGRDVVLERAISQR